MERPAPVSWDPSSFARMAHPYRWLKIAVAMNNRVEGRLYIPYDYFECEEVEYNNAEFADENYSNPVVDHYIPSSYFEEISRVP